MTAGSTGRVEGRKARHLACPRARRALPEEHDQEGYRDELEARDPVKPGAERLLARLVAEQRASGIGARDPAEEGQLQQARLRDAPRLRLGLGLVDAEGGEGGEVHHDQRHDDGEGVAGEFDQIHGARA